MSLGAGRNKEEGQDPPPNIGGGFVCLGRNVRSGMTEFIKRGFAFPSQLLRYRRRNTKGRSDAGYGRAVLLDAIHEEKTKIDQTLHQPRQLGSDPIPGRGKPNDGLDAGEDVPSGGLVTALGASLETSQAGPVPELGRHALLSGILLGQKDGRARDGIEPRTLRTLGGDGLFLDDEVAHGLQGRRTGTGQSRGGRQTKTQTEGRQAKVPEGCQTGGGSIGIVGRCGDITLDESQDGLDQIWIAPEAGACGTMG